MKATLGKNNLGSKNIFIERKKYAQEVPDSLKKYDISSYGRKDDQGNVIIPNSSRVKGIGTSKVTSLDFVSAAYEDFLRLIAKAKVRGFKTTGAYGDLTPKLGYYDVEQQYHSYINFVYSNFVKVFLEQDKRKNQIFSFYDFCEQFIQFSNRTPEFPITKEGFVESIYNSNLSTGLFIAIADEDAGNDAVKAKYINDKFFPFIVDSAKMFGFSVDSNCPWRFMADIGSPGLVPYLEMASTTSNLMFKTHYIKACNIDEYIFYLRLLWATFIKVFPTVSINEGIFYRSDNTDLDSSYFIRMYVYLRIKEKNVIISQDDFERDIQRIIAMSEYFGANDTISEYLLTLDSKGSTIKSNSIQW